MGSFILFVSSGIGFYGHGVILDPLRNLHGWSKGTVSSAITLYFFFNGIVGLIIGRWMDRYGPKWFLIFGSIVFGLGLWALKGIDSIPELFIVYLIMSMGFCSTSLVPINTLITNWFIRKRGLAMSIANTGLSVGGVLLVPLASYLIIQFGLDRALPILGGIYALVIIPMAAFFIKQRPSDMGQYPDGDTRERVIEQEDRGRVDIGQMTVWTRRQAVKTMAFWSIALAFMLALGGQIAYLVHQISFLGQYLGPQKAATAVSITAGASIVGRLALGTFVDRCDKRYVTMVCVLIQGVAVLTLAFYSHVVLLYLCTFAFGLTMGSLIMMQSLIIGECFGIPSFATVSGTIGLFCMPGAAFGPLIAGVIFDATQSYQWSFILFAAASFLAIGVIYFAKPPIR
ncbi:MAG: MFS transporter [Deltaproteobacteria bacterium]|nr:MFS transporter [Deltaproteobacteria bacterium]